MEYVTDMAARRAALTPDRIAFHDLESGEAWTFARVDDAANRFARALQRLGVAPGDRVGIICQNRPEFFVALFACLKREAILAPLNWRQPAAELAPAVAELELKLLVHDDAFSATANELASGGMPLVSLDGDEDDHSFRALIEEADAGPAGAGRRRSGDTWYVLGTSGTTGRPKWVIQTFAMTWANAVNISQAVDLVSTDTSLNFLPLFHTAGINLHAMPLFLAGGTSYVARKFDAGETLKLIGQGRISAFFGVPAVYQAMSLNEAFASTDLGKVRSWTSGGAALSMPLVELYASRGAVICGGMGMTETGPTVFLMDREHVLQKPGSVGKAQILTEVRIVDDTGDPVAPGEAGELQFRGPNITPGYFGNEAATRAAFAEGGWLKTGDVAKADADGYVTIVDRIKDMFISGGENVYPAEVENLLATHPDILEAAVIGVPDERWGEVGRAFLLPRPGHGIDIAALAAWCRERVAAYKVPKTFLIVDDFPRTPAGKVRKPLLREMGNG